MIKKIIYLTSFFCVASLHDPVFSQQENKTDSLLMLLQKHPPEKEKMKLYNDLSFQLHYNNPETALAYADSALLLAKKLKDETNLDKAWFNKGKVYQVMGDFSNCYKCFNHSLEFAEKAKDKEKIIQSLSQIGLCYRNAEKPKKALDYYLRSLKMAEEIGYDQFISGNCINIANVLSDMRQFGDAAEYLKKAIKLTRKNNDERNLSAAYANYAELMSFKGDMDSARVYLLLGIEIDKKLNNLSALSGGYSNLAGLEYMSGNLPEALRLIEEVINIDLKIGSPSILAADYNNLGSVYQEMKKYSEAIRCYEKSLEYSGMQSGLQDVLSSEFGIAQCNAASGNFRNAYDALLNYASLKDTLYDSETNKVIADMKSKYESEKKQLQIQALENKTKIDSLRIEKVNLENAETERKKNQQFYTFSLGFLVLLIISGLIFRGYRQKQKANLLITAQKHEVEKQKEIVEEKNKEILDSISYAKRLQDAILPPLKVVKEYLPESFILYKPKDIVAGDFYFMEPVDSKIVIAAADCTGHGVPGAMVSVVCSNALKRAVKEFKLLEAGKILDKVRELVLETFAQSESEVKDGMDISLCVLETKNNVLYWSGANNPLWIIHPDRKEKIENGILFGENEAGFEFRPDKQPIGKSEQAEPFTTHRIQLEKGDSFYIFTDGFEDQFGGTKGKKFKSSKMKELLVESYSLPMEEQKNKINHAFENWKGDLEQVDDVCIIGIRL